MSIPHPGWLAAGAHALTNYTLVQGRVAPDPGAERGPFDRSLHIDAAVGLWETANLFVTRALFERVGGFQTWITPRRGKALAEDVWFGQRALRAGARAGFCAEARADHAVFPRGAASYIAERARLRFFPAMAARMPELRTAFLSRHVFLNARSARFDLAVAGALAATRAGADIAVVPSACSPSLRTRCRSAPRRPGPGGAVAGEPASPRPTWPPTRPERSHCSRGACATDLRCSEPRSARRRPQRATPTSCAPGR